VFGLKEVLQQIPFSIIATPFESVTIPPPKAPVKEIEDTLEVISASKKTRYLLTVNKLMLITFLNLCVFLFGRVI